MYSLSSGQAAPRNQQKAGPPGNFRATSGLETELIGLTCLQIRGLRVTGGTRHFRRDRLWMEVWGEACPDWALIIDAFHHCLPTRLSQSRAAITGNKSAITTLPNSITTTTTKKWAHNKLMS